MSPVDAHIDDLDETLLAEAAAAIASLPLTSPPRAARRRRASRPEPRTAEDDAFVLHGHPYKETSLIVDALTRRHGRVALVARGAKRPRSALRGVLLAFQPLSLGWTQARARAVSGAASGGELRTLTRAEWVGGIAPLRGEALMAGFYVNELVQKLLARDDPHERLFDAYAATLAALGEGLAAAPLLRRFEAALLQETGYALQVTHAADGAPIDAAASYRYLPERGPHRIDAADADSDAIVSGRTLVDIGREDYRDATTLGQSKRLMRFLLAHHLSGQELQTRRLLLDLQSLAQSTEPGPAA